MHGGCVARTCSPVDFVWRLAPSEPPKAPSRSYSHRRRGRPESMHSRSSGCRSNPTETKMTTPTEVRRKQTPPRVIDPGDLPAIR